MLPGGRVAKEEKRRMVSRSNSWLSYQSKNQAATYDGLPANCNSGELTGLDPVLDREIRKRGSQAPGLHIRTAAQPSIPAHSRPAS